MADTTNDDERPETYEPPRRRAVAGATGATAGAATQARPGGLVSEEMDELVALGLEYLGWTIAEVNLGLLARRNNGYALDGEGGRGLVGGSMPG